MLKCKNFIVDLRHSLPGPPKDHARIEPRSMMLTCMLEYSNTMPHPKILFVTATGNAFGMSESFFFKKILQKFVKYFTKFAKR
jgi:hypothetical protein